MDAKEIIKKVRRIELRSKRKANHLFLGEYHSTFKGKGMIFSEIRPYQFGDDVRKIDWNKTARFQEPYVKVFEEERELTMLLMVDISGSEHYGTRKQQKRETIAEICATLAFSAISYNDKVGLILFSEEVELLVPPKKGKKHVLRIIREIVEFEPKSKKTNISNSLKYLMDTFKRKANVFILSDFIDESNYYKQLKVAAKKHYLTGIRIFDEKENVFPNIGWVHLRDNETGEVRFVNTNAKSVRRQHQLYHAKMNQKFNELFQRSGAGTINLRADEDYIIPLINLFKSHSN